MARLSGCALLSWRKSVQAQSSALIAHKCIVMPYMRSFQSRPLPANAAGSFIDEFRVGTNTFDNGEFETSVTVISSIGATCVKDRAGTPGGNKLMTIGAAEGTNGSVTTIQMAGGFDTFPIS